MIRSFRDLVVWQKSYQLAMDIFNLASKFPKEETYSLTSQIIRSSRSVSANITEGWAKREYESVFKRHLIDSLGSNAETANWLDFALNCGYITIEEYTTLVDRLNEVGRMLTKLHQNWSKFKG